MSRRGRVVLTVFAVLLVAVLVANIRVKEPADEFDVSIATSLPYSLPGPHSVGTRALTIDGEPPLEITVWYPALMDDSREKAVKYAYEMKMFDPLGAVSFATYKGIAVADASYDLVDSPYPLVILSPGFSIGSSTYAWEAEHLASYGFVVISPEHPEQLDPENELWQQAITRPQDILAVLAYVDEQVSSDGIFEGLIDTELVTVVGHSYGGYTALAAAGAQIDTEGFEAHCEHVREVDDPSAWLCDDLLPHMADMAALAGLDFVPEGLWPAWADPRVDAVVSMAGDAFFFGQAGLAAIDVPVMVISGTADVDSPYMWGTYPTYEYVSSPAKVRIALTDAEHMIFTAPCQSMPLFMKPISSEFCTDPGWDRNYAHALVNHFMTAFLLAELKQDAGAANALAPDVIDLPDMTYEAEGY